MLNFSGIPRGGVIGRLLRLPLTVIPPSTVVRILQGRLRGCRWIVGAETHGCWLGSYELAKQRQFGDAIKESNIVYDIGANVGFYSLLASRCIGSMGQVHAFEPLPENLVFLEKHIRLNHCTMFQFIVSQLVIGQPGCISNGVTTDPPVSWPNKGIWK